CSRSRERWGGWRSWRGRGLRDSCVRGCVKKLIAVLALSLIAAAAFAHAGHMHTYMGTVTMLHDDGSFMIKTTDGKDMTIAISAATTWDPARTDLAVGKRVVVKMALDGKTAASAKMSKYLSPRRTALHEFLFPLPLLHVRGAHRIHRLHLLDLGGRDFRQIADEVDELPRVGVVASRRIAPRRHARQANAVLDDCEQLAVGQILRARRAHVRG